MDSILTSSKTLGMLGSEYDVFDPQIIAYINSVFLVLKQLGVGPKEGFFVTDKNSTWDEFLPDDEFLRESIKAYMGHKVRLQFDPPASSVHVEALKAIIAEFEWRLNTEVD